MNEITLPLAPLQVFLETRCLPTPSFPRLQGSMQKCHYSWTRCCIPGLSHAYVL